MALDMASKCRLWLNAVQFKYVQECIQAAAADERKACAKIAEQYDSEVADEIAREIRARESA